MALGDGDAGFGSNFYKNLFADYPALKETLFKNVAIDAQRMNLPKSITSVLALLTDMPKAVDALQQLGLRHVTYGTPDSGYPIVGSILVKTLALLLGSDFTADAKKEWITVYSLIQKTMIDAAYSDKAASWWQRFYAKRGKELQAILDVQEIKDPLALSKSIGSATSIAEVAAAIVETKSVTAPVVVGFTKGMTADQIKSLNANLANAIEKANPNKTLSAYDKMVIEWFAGAVTPKI